MRRAWILIFIVALIGQPVLASTLHDSVVKELNGLGGVHAIRIENVNGDCQVLVHDADSVAVRANITVKGASDGACDEFYRSLSIELTRGDAGVLVRVVYPKSRSWFGFGKSPRAVVDLSVSIPAGWDVAVDLVNGDVEITDAGSCNIDLVNGDVEVNRTDKLVAGLVNGRVTAKGVRRVVTCDIINGGLRATMEGPNVEKVTADIVNGDVELDIACADIGRMYMESATGKVVLQEQKKDGTWQTKLKSKRIRMAENGSTCIILKTVNGRITVRCMS